MLFIHIPLTFMPFLIPSNVSWKILSDYRFNKVGTSLPNSSTHFNIVSDICINPYSGTLLPIKIFYQTNVLLVYIHLSSDVHEFMMLNSDKSLCIVYETQAYIFPLFIHPAINTTPTLLNC